MAEKADEWSNLADLGDLPTFAPPRDLNYRYMSWDDGMPDGSWGGKDHAWFFIPVGRTTPLDEFDDILDYVEDEHRVVRITLVRRSG
jgi:hypothetical protein